MKQKALAHLKAMKLLFGIFFCLNLFGQTPPEYFKNPILPGFYPDPSICRVGDTYYMVEFKFRMVSGTPHSSK